MPDDSMESPAPPAFPPPPDYSSWLKKAEVAEALAVATKTVEVWTRNGKLEQAMWRRPGGGPALAVFNPSDVRRLYAEKFPERPPFVLPAPKTPDNGNGHQRALATVHELSTGSEALQTFFERLAATLRSQPAPTSESSENVALTVEEASAETRLTRGYIRRQMREKKVPVIMDRPRRIARKNLGLLLGLANEQEPR